MATALEKFFVELGFEVDDKELAGFAKTLEVAKYGMLALGAAAVAAVGAMAGFAAHIAGEVDDLGDFAEQEQVSVEALQELGHAAQLNGSSMDAVKGSVQGLNRVMGEAILGIGRGAKVFEHLGLEAKDSQGKVKTFDQILEDVADKMQGLSRQEQVALAEKLGIDRSLVPLLLKGKKALQEYREEAKAMGVVTAEEAETAGAFADSMDRTKFLLKAVSDRIAIKMLPGMQRMLDRFRQWIMNNKELIAQSIDRVISVLVSVVSVLADIVFTLAKGFAELVNWVINNKVVMYGLIVAFSTLIGLGILGFFTSAAGTVMGLAKALMAVNFQAMIIPALIGLIIAGILLLIEDIYQWRQGNASVVGEILEKYPGVIEMINQVASSVRSIGQAYDDVVDKVSRFIEWVAKSAETVQGLFSMGFGGGASMRLPNLSQPGGPIGSGGNWSNTTNSNQTNNFHISSTDPKGAAAEVGKVMTKQNRNISRNNRSAVVQ